MATAQAKERTWSYVLAEPTKILVVDDDPILREFAKVYLATPAATIETAADVDGALALMRAQAFDIVLVDIEMPRRDGYELLEIMRRTPATRNIPVMMLTGPCPAGVSTAPMAMLSPPLAPKYVGTVRSSRDSTPRRARFF